MEWISIATNVILTTFAGIALYVGYRQILISNEIAARSAYENYHLLCLQYPQFSAGTFDFAGATEQERECYTVFVLYMLMTGERIYTLFPNDPGWIFAIEEDVQLHSKFIDSPYFADHLLHQQWVTSSLIERVLKENRASAI